MECTTVLPLSQLSFFPPKPCNRQNRAYPSRPWKQRTSQPTRFNCQKMYVPGFGEASPEAKAANNLHHFFTYVAVSIVTAQLQVPPTCYAMLAYAHKSDYWLLWCHLPTFTFTIFCLLKILVKIKIKSMFDTIMFQKLVLKTSERCGQQGAVDSWRWWGVVVSHQSW